MFNLTTKKRDRNSFVRTRPGSTWSRTRSNAHECPRSTGSMGQQWIADDAHGAVTSSPTYRNVYAHEVDEPILRHTGTGTTLPTTGDIVLASSLQLSPRQRTPSSPPLSSSCSSSRSSKLKTSNPCNHRNQQYSIISLTNSAGTWVERYSYTPYGTLGIYNPSGTVLTTSSFANRYTYTGREYAPELNVYQFRAHRPQQRRLYLPRSAGVCRWNDFDSDRWL
jgi:hypothetical protein